MDGFVIVLLLVVAALLFLQLFARHGAREAPVAPWFYRRRQALFTPAERSFAAVLDKVLDVRYRVYGKVRVVELIEPLPCKDRRIWQKAFNRISTSHFDFVVCNSSDLAPVCVVELDDSGYQRSKKLQHDEVLTRICLQVKLPLVRVPAKRDYKQADVAVILEALRDIAGHAAAEPAAPEAPMRAVRNAESV